MENNKDKSGLYSVYKRAMDNKYKKLDINAKSFVVDKMSKIEDKTKITRQYCEVMR